MLPVSGSNIDVGKPAAFPSYGWDNEYGERRVEVPSFQATKNMIINGELWHFVAEGGYRSEKYWCEDGWDWRTHRNMKWPFFWEPCGSSGSNEFSLRAIFEVIPMQWDWPVDVNYYEAKAYCRWKMEKYEPNSAHPYRLLTEAEHHLLRPEEHNLDAARQDPASDKVMVTLGEQFPHGPTVANLNLAYSSQNPVGTYPSSKSGHFDVTGNAWEWTEDHFNPLSGFEVHHIYDDFSKLALMGSTRRLSVVPSFQPVTRRRYFRASTSGHTFSNTQASALFCLTARHQLLICSPDNSLAKLRPETKGPIPMLILVPW